MDKTLNLINEPMLMEASRLVSLIESQRMIRASVKVKDPIHHLAVGDKTIAVAMSAGVTHLQSGVGIIFIHGPMFKDMGSWGYADQNEIRMHVRNAANDPSVSSIMLHIDSPGGSVAGTHDLADEVRAAAKKKPVVAYVDDLCASAAMWVASAANEIYANNEDAIIGSIGVVTGITDYSEALKQAGIKVTMIATGEYKTAGSPYVETKPEHVEYIRAMIEKTMDSFVSAVSKGRGMRAETIRGWQAKVFNATEATDLKLIDGIMSFDQAFLKLAKQTGKKAATVRALAEQAILEMEN